MKTSKTFDPYTLKKGMKVILPESNPNSKYKKGEVVKVTKAENPGSDFEQIRVCNEHYSWRVSSCGMKLA